MAMTAAPIPIPALTAVDRPFSGAKVCGGDVLEDGTETCAKDGRKAGSEDDVEDGVEVEEDVEVELLVVIMLTGPSEAAITIGFPEQQAVLFRPQHHLVNSAALLPQGVTFTLSLRS